MYIQELRDEFLEVVPGAAVMSDRPAFPLIAPHAQHYEEIGRSVAIEAPTRPTLRHTPEARPRSRSHADAAGRERPRSR